MIPAYPALPFFLLFFFLLNPPLSFTQSDGHVLLKFKASLHNAAALSNWDISTSPCTDWAGVVCDRAGLVWALQLERMNLQGTIDVETLAHLSNLRSLSFIHNNFEGSLPYFARIGALKTIYLSENRFSGEIPENVFRGMNSLKKLHLADNKFSGPIPSALATLPKLMELTLQDNEFEGHLPNFRQEGFKLFNASNNRLDGPIPRTLSHLHASAFYGNQALCGAPFQQCPAVNTTAINNFPTTISSEKKRLPTTTIVVAAVLIGATLVALLAACIFFFICRKRRSQHAEAGGATSTADVNQMERGASSSTAAAAPDRAAKPSARLTFLKDQGSKKFNMQELLKASAEVLGGSALGSSYKAGLNGKMMVVKRFKHMNQVSKQEFNEHMRRLGRMAHQNVQPILAFYYRKEEKLLVAEFAPNLSLADRLHGDQARDHRSLDWFTRLRIVKGVAEGLVYLHNELLSLTPPHGHLKASNVLLDASFKPLLTDYGLLPIINKDQAQENITAYNSPEFKATRKLNKKTDVWSFGLLILEILTRKSSGSEQQGEVDLVTWVKSAMDDESGGRAAVFDHEMAGSNHSHGEMLKLLTVALVCCQADVESRPDIKEVALKVEEIKERDFEDDYYSSYSYVSETDMRSERGLSDDFKSIIM